MASVAAPDPGAAFFLTVGEKDSRIWVMLGATAPLQVRLPVTMLPTPTPFVTVVITTIPTLASITVTPDTTLPSGADLSPPTTLPTWIPKMSMV